MRYTVEKRDGDRYLWIVDDWMAKISEPEEFRLAWRTDLRADWWEGMVGRETRTYYMNPGEERFVVDFHLGGYDYKRVMLPNKATAVETRPAANKPRRRMRQGEMHVPYWVDGRWELYPENGWKPSRAVKG